MVAPTELTISAKDTAILAHVLKQELLYQIKEHHLSSIRALLQARYCIVETFTSKDADEQRWEHRDLAEQYYKEIKQRAVGRLKDNLPPTLVEILTPEWDARFHRVQTSGYSVQDIYECFLFPPE